MRAVFRRELRSYFTSYIGYVFSGVFLVFSGIFFAITNLLSGSPSFLNVLNTMTFVCVFLMPILTMRLLSEDRRQKTDQLLITSPVGITAIVLGKYLAAMVYFLATLAVTVLYPVIMSFYALGGLGWWEILGSYIGFVMLMSSFIAIGLFFSAITENQLIAAVATLATLLFIWILDSLAQALPADPVSGMVFLALLGGLLVLLMYLSSRSAAAAIATFVIAAAVVVLLYVFSRGSFDGLIGRIFGWFSLLRRYGDFSLGLLGLGPVVYYLSFSGAFVFLTTRVIEKRRWA
jgi:ABC-2 type transport system permease protein